MENTEEKVEEVLLVASVNDVTINQICAILNDNNIPFLKVDEGSGSYMNVYMGFSNQEKRILVNKEDYEKAKELISPVLTTTEEEGLEKDELPEELKEDAEVVKEKVDSKTAHKMLWQIFGFLLVLVPTIIVLIVLILGNILY